MAGFCEGVHLPYGSRAGIARAMARIAGSPFHGTTLAIQRGSVRNLAIPLHGVLSLLWASIARADDTYRFVQEYVRELVALKGIAVNAKQDSRSTNANPFAVCIRIQTRYEQELNTSMGLRMALNHILDEANLGLRAFYEQRVVLHQRFAALCTRLIAAPPKDVDDTKINAEISKIRSDLDSTDAGLLSATILIEHGLVDERPDTQNHFSHLVITRAQRKDTMQTLETAFGKKSDQNDSDFSAYAATLFRDFLSQDYKCSDDPW